MTEGSLPRWMGNVRANQRGFPFPVDRDLYSKQNGIVYKASSSVDMALDAYLPVGDQGGPRARVVMIHGEGWHGGGRFQMGLSRWAGYLACAGLCVFSIDYRLAPATHYPDSLQDCLDAIGYLVDRAEEFGMDPERVGLWSDSAGGHLALLTSTTQTHPRATGPRLLSGGEKLRAVVAWYPPTDLRALHELEREIHPGPTTVSRFAGAEPAANPEVWHAISPLEQVHSGTPPCLILQGTADLLVPADRATRYVARAREVRAQVELHLVEGAPHGLDRVAPGPEACRLIERSPSFLLEHLESKPNSGPAAGLESV